MKKPRIDIFGEEEQQLLFPSEDSELAILFIEDYRDWFLFEPKLNWDEEEFKARSYDRWAVDEILSRIHAHMDEKPIDILNSFEEELDQYLKYDQTAKNPCNEIFLAAKGMCNIFQGPIENIMAG